MTIGLDLTSLQGAHRMRGIGYTLINFINNVSKADRKKHHFVFYAYPFEDDQLLELLKLDGMSYEIREIKPRYRSKKKLPGRLNLLISTVNQLAEIKSIIFGDSRIKDLRDVKVFLQTDQSEALPRKWGVKKVLVIYDLIPYVLDWEYLWTYKIARLRGFSCKAAFRVQVRRWLYAFKIKANIRRANILLSISKRTKNDFIRYMGTPNNKIVVTTLGVNLPEVKSETEVSLKRYFKTSWGYLPKSFKFDQDIPFMLFVGGADKRRKLEDLVAAFNILRAQGVKLQLVMAGDCMQGPDNIATEEIQYALKTSSYIDDIVFMGFVDDQARDWLYSHARAFVFPSRYEGFGLPVLEAMSYGTPVICYEDAAVKEVAADYPFYANDPLSLADAMRQYLYLDEQNLKKERSNNIIQAGKWQWDHTSSKILSEISRFA